MGAGEQPSLALVWACSQVRDLVNREAAAIWIPSEHPLQIDSVGIFVECDEMNLIWLMKGAGADEKPVGVTV